jgi:hypothetical protein
MYEQANTRFSNCRLILAITSLLSGCAVVEQDWNTMTIDRVENRSYIDSATGRTVYCSRPYSSDGTRGHEQCSD